jgi:hypothetical protein
MIEYIIFILFVASAVLRFEFDKASTVFLKYNLFRRKWDRTRVGAPWTSDIKREIRTNPNPEVVEILKKSVAIRRLSTILALICIALIFRDFFVALFRALFAF